MDKYYIMVGSQQEGPYTKQEIIDKGFSKDSLVFNKSLGSWRKISEVEDFAEINLEKDVSSSNEKVLDSQIKYEDDKDSDSSNDNFNKKIKIKFDRKEKKYSPIRYTIIILTILNALIEAAYSGGKSSYMLSVMLTYWISVSIMRYIYLKNKDFSYKILKTVGVFLGVYFGKSIIIIVIMSIFFPNLLEFI